MSSPKGQASAALYEKDAEPTTAGKLVSEKARQLLRALNRREFSGYLLLSHREKKKKVWFSRGDVFRVQSNLVPELMGHMMVERGWINEADLKTCLDLQKDLLLRTQNTRRLGEWVQDLYGIEPQEVQDLYQLQQIRSLIQAFAWEEGHFEVVELKIESDQTSMIGLNDILISIENLLSEYPAPLGKLFQIDKPWNPISQTLDLARTPLWSVLAGCQRTGANGIVSIRKQNRLYEIVIKNGVPLLLYEGSFGQPRQTLIVRKASAEHEKFFVDQVFKIFGFLSGSAHFRTLGESAHERESFLQIMDDQEEGETSQSDSPGTQVTRSIEPEVEVPFELKSQFLAKRRDLFRKTWDLLIRFVKA